MGIVEKAIEIEVLKDIRSVGRKIQIETCRFAQIPETARVYWWFASHGRRSVLEWIHGVGSPHHMVIGHSSPI
jgi:hypothetical protein